MATNADDGFVAIKICGQEFRLRMAAEDREKAQQVALMVEERVHERRSQGIFSDFRAALIAAFEFSFDLAGMKEELERNPLATQKLERLIEQLDQIKDQK